MRHSFDMAISALLQLYFLLEAAIHISLVTFLWFIKSGLHYYTRVNFTFCFIISRKSCFLPYGTPFVYHRQQTDPLSLSQRKRQHPNSQMPSTPSLMSSRDIRFSVNLTHYIIGASVHISQITQTTNCDLQQDNDGLSKTDFREMILNTGQHVKQKILPTQISSMIGVKMTFPVQ